MPVADAVPRAAATTAMSADAPFRLLPLAAIAWAATAATLLAIHPHALAAMSPDDLMRLAEVRDWLAGQGWFDVTQYRLHPPSGVAMHWSRLADVPIAALIVALSPLLGRAGAEAAAAAAWPLMLLFPTVMLVGALARRLSNGAAMLPAILLVAISAPVLIHFAPGALDHHGLQMLLLLATLCGVSGNGDARYAPALAGLAAALSIAVGIEMVPALAAILAAVGLRWAIEGECAATLTASFGLAFGIAIVLLFGAMVPPAHWANAVCDQISLPFVTAAALCGGLLALLAMASRRLAATGARLAAGSAAAGGTLAIVALVFPACLQSPFAHLDPRVAAVWIANVAETQNIFVYVRNAPDQALLNYVPALAALGLALAALRHAPARTRTRWLAPIFATVILYAVSLWEIRGGPAAAMVARPLTAAAVISLFGVRRSFLASRRALLVLLALSTPALSFAGKAVGKTLSALNLAQPVFYQSGPLACRGLGDIAPLAQLPPGLVASHIDLGSAILVATRHAVLAAPYHRNSEGNRIDFAILLGDDAAARRLLAENHVDYVAICPGAPERYNLRKVAPEGLAERLARGEVPAYLEPVAADAAQPLKIFRVRPSIPRAAKPG